MLRTTHVTTSIKHQQPVQIPAQKVLLIWAQLMLQEQQQPVAPSNTDQQQTAADACTHSELLWQAKLTKQLQMPGAAAAVATAYVSSFQPASQHKEWW